MRIFAAIERILLDRWTKIKHNLGINKWPLLNRKEQQLQLKKQYLESLLDEKWHKFGKPIIRAAQVAFTPSGSCYNIAVETHRVSCVCWDSAEQGRNTL